MTQSKTIPHEFTIIVTKNKFDNASRLLNISHTGDNKTYADYYNPENRISKTDKDNKTTKYFWDHRNRLTKVETPTETIEYIYDHQNRLVKRTDNQNTTTFIHDDWQIILQFDNKESKPTNRYLWGTKQDELICNNNNWTLNDHLNTIRDIIKPDGNVASHLEYNAFGKLISETKNDSLLFAYTGKLFDAVNMTTIPGWESTTLPPNVRSASHAIKTSSLEIIYPTKRYKGVTEKLFYKSDGSVTTHGEIGQGWALPTSVWDNSVINWMKEQAIAKKVPVKP